MTQNFVKLKKSLIMIMLNILTAENVIAILKQANLATKAHIADFVKETGFNNKLNNLNKNVTSNKTKHSLLKNEKLK